MCGTSCTFLLRSGFSFGAAIVIWCSADLNQKPGAAVGNALLRPLYNDMFDVAIVGSGPAGASCAAFCANAGLRTLLLERENFPREKVCGDCLNPACWPILRRLGLMEEVRTLPHGQSIASNSSALAAAVGRPLAAARSGDRSQTQPVRSASHGTRARARGGNVRRARSRVTRPLARRMKIGNHRGEGSFRARMLVAADGRNSTVARLCNLLPRSARERIALQTHMPLPPDFGDRVVLQFLPQGIPVRRRSATAN